MRSSGVLMHISSLPSPYGIGTMGKAAVQFVDFLGRQDRLTGRFCRYARPVMEILRISLFPALQETLIL